MKSKRRTQIDRQRDAVENIPWYTGENLFDYAWIGPTFDPKSPDYTRKQEALKRVFQSHNVLRELVDNWRDGLIGNRFRWYLKGEDGERIDSDGNDLAAKAEEDLQRWIDWVEQQYAYMDPACTEFEMSDLWTEFVTAVGVCGRGYLRLWQPERFANDPDPIHRIHLHVPLQGSVYHEYSILGFLDKLRYSYAGGLESQTLDDQGFVTINGDEASRIDTGGRWLIQQVVKPSLFTESAKKKQAAICHALTMKLRNQELGGFKERVLLNAEIPADTDEDGNPINIERGPGIDQYVYGIPYGEVHNPSYTNPSVFESQPVPITTFTDSIAIDRSLLYLEFRQAHLLASDVGGISFESRVQARQNFEVHLSGWKRPIETALANVLNIVLKLLNYEGLEAVVDLQITTGKLTPEEKKAIIDEFKAGLMSKTTAIAILGSVSDVDAELALIEEERAASRPAQPRPEFDMRDRPNMQELPTDEPPGNGEPQPSDPGNQNTGDERTQPTAA